jgi:hypothetical protein
MAKSDWTGRLVRPHGVKRQDDLAAALHPAAMLAHAVFANVKRIEDSCAIRSQVERKDPFRGIGRGCVTFVSPSEISLLPPGKTNRSGSIRARQLAPVARDRYEPAKRQQVATELGTDAKKPEGSGVHDE